MEKPTSDKNPFAANARRTSSVERDYWLTCRQCSWCETAYASDQGVDWPREVRVEQGRAYHRRCGGLLTVVAR